MDPQSRLHPKKAFPLCSSQSVSSCRCRARSYSAGPAGFILVDVSVLNLFNRKIYSYVSNICEADAVPISLDSREKIPLIWIQRREH